MTSSKHHLIQWSNAPIIVPRWMLTVKYAILVLLGVAISIATSPSLEAALGDWLTPFWGYGISLSAIVAAIGSANFAWEALERWASSALAILLLVYAFSPVWIILTEGDHDRLAYSVTALALSVIPTARAIYLLRRTGLKLPKDS